MTTYEQRKERHEQRMEASMRVVVFFLTVNAGLLFVILFLLMQEFL